MLILIYATGGVIALISLINPRWGTYIFWFGSLLYPSSLLYSALPFNVHFDDLFLIWLTLACLRLAPPDVLTSRSFIIACLWFSTVLFGTIVGMLTAPEYIRFAALKSLGKQVYVPLLAFITNVVCRDDRTLRRMLNVMFIAAFLACAIGMIQVYHPEWVRIWEAPTEITLSEGRGNDTEETRRAGDNLGTYMSILSYSTALIALRMFARMPTLRQKAISGLSAIYAMIALGYTVTRGAIFGFAAAVLVSLAKFRRRAAMAVVVTGSLLLIGTQTDLGSRLWYRIVGEKNQAELNESVGVRANIWSIYLGEFSVHYLLFGRGFTAEYVRHGALSAHNTFVGAIAYTGLYGVIVVTWILFRLWRMGTYVARIDPDPYGQALGESLVLLIVAMTVQGMAGEVWQWSEPFFFTFAALVDIRRRLLESGELHAPEALTYGFPVVTASAHDARLG